MSRILRPPPWLPSLVVGLSAAVAAELSLGLLVYTTPGYLRALTLVLAVQLGALGMGLATAPRASERAFTERVRRRWLFALVSFVAAAVAAGFWSVRGGLAADTLSRGLGLALLAALPLYACGVLLGALSDRRWTWSPKTRVGAAAAMGAALGAILSGYTLISLLIPASVYAFCLVLLSGAALAHGRLLSLDGERTVLEEAASSYGTVSVEEWTWGGVRASERLLLENGALRGAEDARGLPRRSWEGAVLELTRPMEREGPRAALIFGGGAFTLPRHLAGRGWDVDLVERNPVVVTAAVRHFAVAEDEVRPWVVDGSPERALERCPGPYRCIVIDAAALGDRDPIPLATPPSIGALSDRLSDDGVLLVGGVHRAAAGGKPLREWLEATEHAFPQLGVYTPRGGPDEAVEAAAGPWVLALAMTKDPSIELGPTLGGLALDAVHRTSPSPTLPRSLP